MFIASKWSRAYKAKVVAWMASVSRLSPVIISNASFLP